MSIEDVLASVVARQLAPLQNEIRSLREQVSRLEKLAPPQLVKPKEAAALLGLSLSTVRRRIKDGSLPVKKVGKVWRVDLAALHSPDEEAVQHLVQKLKVTG